MSPLPAQALCNRCHGELFYAPGSGVWHHADPDTVPYQHRAVPMSPNERDDYEAEQRELLKSLPLIDPKTVKRGSTS